MLLQPRPTSLSPAHISSHNPSSSFNFFTPSVIANMNASSAPTSPQLKRGSMSTLNEKVPVPPTTPSLHTITVVSVASHPLPQQNAVRIDMKLRIPISLFTPTQQAALATVKQRELTAMKKRKRSECTLKGCACVSCKEEPVKDEIVETSEITTPPPEIVSIASATSAFKKLKSSSTPSSPPLKSTSIPSSPSPPSTSSSTPSSPPSKSTSIPSSPPSKSTSAPSSPYDEDHLSLLDLPMTFRNHKSWYANPFNTKRPPKPVAKVAIVKQKDETIAKSKDGENGTISPSHLSPPASTQTTPSLRTRSPLPHSPASTGLLSTDYVYRDVNVVIPATSSMDVAIQVHKHSVKIRCAGHTLVTLNAHHLFTF